MKKFISFISPVYNVNGYLDDYFASFVELKDIDFEIIIMDDRGQEDPYEIVKKWEDKLPIKFIKNPKNLGLGFARNAGLEHVSPEATHIMYVDSDDKLWSHDFAKDIEVGKITWFNAQYFDTVADWYKDRIANWGKNLFPNTIWGVAIPVDIAKKVLFETKNYEDLLVNRRLVKRYGDVVKLSPIAVVAYRCRASGINNSKPTAVKYKDFRDNMIRLINEDINTYRFNIQEIYQYYWMWRKHLKAEIKVKDLPDTKWYYKVMFWFTGSMIRWLKLERVVYGRGSKTAFK